MIWHYYDEHAYFCALCKKLPRTVSIFNRTPKGRSPADMTRHLELKHRKKIKVEDIEELGADSRQVLKIGYRVARENQGLQGMRREGA